MGAKQIIFYPNIFTYYDKYMVKFSCSLIITIMSMKDGILNVGKLWMLVGEKMGNRRR